MISSAQWGERSITVILQLPTIIYHLPSTNYQLSSTNYQPTENIMARFTQVPQNFLFRKLLEYWGNMVRNYGENCRDDDFFAVANINFDHDRGVELIQVAYTANELEEMKKEKARYARLDFSDTLDDVLQLERHFFRRVRIKLSRNRLSLISHQPLKLCRLVG